MLKKQYQWIRHTHYYLMYGVMSLSISMLVNATEPEQKPVIEEAEFDAAFLIGDAKKIDIDRFKYGNPVLSGNKPSICCKYSNWSNSVGSNCRLCNSNDDPLSERASAWTR